ncbi:uracil-DNA glycosylase family protein [Shewanella livingstonensis]|uniref:Uracil-DNA glycosylase family protein n=2 Tax=Shewanella livingstonensis TaxID=150120 RepID=A0A3G8LS18_9GAMM|nr:uracil-DNA glycosylase family protein [Shewanella livingstonensis]AZG72406.1 uracil-DNA glycosylase family protein [Shewanella livingstonensis]
MTPLLTQVKNCQLCASELVDGVRPVVQIDPQAKVLIIGQAPGRKVHLSGIPFDDASGDRLRQWLGVTREVFYDAKQIAIMPMGFCYPGSYTASTINNKGRSGDLPPRSECAPKWHDLLLQHLTQVQLVLLVGQYAQQYYLPNKPKTLTETVQLWRTFGPRYIPLPHPSPRNNIWLSRNPWFEDELLSHIRQRVAIALA